MSKLIEEVPRLTADKLELGKCYALVHKVEEVLKKFDDDHMFYCGKLVDSKLTENDPTWRKKTFLLTFEHEGQQDTISSSISGLRKSSGEFVEVPECDLDIFQDWREQFVGSRGSRSKIMPFKRSSGKLHAAIKEAVAFNEGLRAKSKAAASRRSKKIGGKKLTRNRKRTNN